jgi:hypothetical protein
MDMIGYAAKGVDAMLVARDPFLKQQVDLIAVPAQKIACPPLPRSMTW